MNNRLFPSLGILALLLFQTLAAELPVSQTRLESAAAPSAALTLAVKDGAAPVVFAAEKDAALQRAAALWTGYFRARGFKPTVIPVTAGQRPELPETGAVFAFETEAICPLARELKLDLSKLKNARPEANVLTVRAWRGRPLALVVGKTVVGADTGANFLLSKVACALTAEGDWTVTAAPLEAYRTPFFRGREATLCPTGRVVPQHPDVNYEQWNQARLESYPAFLKACGFNSVQVMDLVTYHGATRTWAGGYRDGVPQGKTIADVQKAIFTLADAAHANGMTVSQFIWGSPPNDGCRWDDPKTQPTRALFYSELARIYGAKVDHIITHWQDEGNEGGMDTPLRASMFLWKEYKKQNPSVRVTCDSWFNAPLYTGIGDETRATKDVAIAIERWYDPARAEQILKAGRKVGIWGWYLSDFEMTYGSHLYTQTLDKYFAALPDKAGEQVDWISLEKCFHALPAQINLYVVGRKMWEPKAARDELVLDYCRAVYGPAYAEIMQRAYAAAEAGQTEVRYGMVQQDRYPPTLGTAAFKKTVEGVLADIQKVVLPVGWRANFAVVGTPQHDVDFLRAQLEGFANTPVKDAN